MVKIVHGDKLFEMNVKQNIKDDKTAYDTEEKDPSRKRFKFSEVPLTDKS